MITTTTEDTSKMVYLMAMGSSLDLTIHSKANFIEVFAKKACSKTKNYSTAGSSRRIPFMDRESSCSRMELGMRETLKVGR